MCDRSQVATISNFVLITLLGGVREPEAVLAEVEVLEEVEEAAEDRPSNRAP